MFRKLIIAIFAFLIAIPAFARNTNTQPATGQSSTGKVPAVDIQAQPALRLMNDTEFSSFLERLDWNLSQAEDQMKKMDVSSLTPDPQAKEELERIYGRCLRSVDNSRDEVQKLSERQTLKLDLFLLIDLNDLGRNLDLLDESLVNPALVNGTARAQKSLAYAKAILEIDGSLATEISVFEHHFVAFAGVVDESLAQANQDTADPQPQK